LIRMQTISKPTRESTERRRRAEKRMQDKHPEAGPDRSEAEIRRLVHELQVHEIELEMQNEELQQARDAVETGLEKYSDLYEFAPVGYVTLNSEGTIQEANLTAATLLGIERTRLLKRRFGLQVAPDDQATWSRFLGDIFENRNRQICEVALLREGNSQVALRIEAAVTASGRECRAALIDVTAHNQLERDQLIISKLESTGILAGGVAHDFNNLLTVMLLNVEMARTYIPPTGELAHHLEDARKAVLLARGLTMQLISFAKGGSPARKPVSLSRLVEEAARMALSGSNILCHFSATEDAWFVDADEGQLGQVIRNLVQNAREAMSNHGSIAVQIENVVLNPLDHPSLPAGKYVRVTIVDQGGGIAKEVLPLIFDPYFSTKQRGEQKGMGLGLTICHSIIRRHGGAISVDSRLQKGTTFCLHLPACHRMHADSGDTPDTTTLPRIGRVLVMDDEAGIREALGTMLTRMGHAVELLADGENAVGAYARAIENGLPFDAVILDLTVRGGMGGQEAIQALLKIDPTVKAIVMSGYADDPVLRDPARHGFKGKLAKPFNRETLGKTLAKVMRSAAPPRKPGESPITPERLAEGLNTQCPLNQA
jgi:two-component system, cell cycle sensor histidine kinase and response regulator CckA